MHWSIRRTFVVALVLLGLVLGGAVLMGSEVWLASRGARPSEPPATPGDSPAGPPPSPDVAAHRVVWLGDSTAAGVGASGLGTTLPEQVANQIGVPIRLTVLARSGARIADVVRVQLPQLSRLDPTEVFISVGANDATHLTLRSRFRRDYNLLLSGLPASVVRVVLLGVPDLGSAPRLAQPLRAVAGWRGRALASDIRNLARRRHVAYVDIAGGTGPAFRREPDRYFAPDHYHPSDAGYRLWATVVAATVRAAH